MTRSDDIGKLILRLALGVMILMHGLSKLQGGLGFIEGQLTANGLPTALAYFVYIGEILAPVLLIVGVFSRVAAVLIALNMLVALYLVHTHEIFTLGKTGGWAIELQGMFLSAAVALALLGAGRLSLGGTGAKFN